MNIDEWAAEQCGIVLYTPKQINEHGMYYYDDWGNDFDYEWTIQDPRCREIVREHFKIWTYYGSVGTDKMGWVSTSANNDMAGTYGKTIAEAEIGCIEAIYKTFEGDL